MNKISNALNTITSQLPILGYPEYSTRKKVVEVAKIAFTTMALVVCGYETLGLSVTILSAVLLVLLGRALKGQHSELGKSIVHFSSLMGGSACMAAAWKVAQFALFLMEETYAGASLFMIALAVAGVGSQLIAYRRELKIDVPPLPKPKVDVSFSEFAASRGYFLNEEELAKLNSSLKVLKACERSRLAKGANEQDTQQKLLDELGQVRPFSRGFILGGPPGAGKTSIAKLIADFLEVPDARVHMKTSTSLQSKWVGETEENIRELFGNAQKDWNEWHEHAPLHVVVIDEFDGLFATRGSDPFSKSGDKFITELLGILDGVNSPKNVLVIGTANHPDKIDEAMVRPGRLQLLTISLPDLSSRTKLMLHLLQKSIKHLKGRLSFKEFSKMAVKTEGWSFAQIQGFWSQVQQEQLFEPALSEMERGELTKLPKIDLRALVRKYLGN